MRMAVQFQRLCSGWILAVDHPRSGGQRSLHFRPGKSPLHAESLEVNLKGFSTTLTGFRNLAASPRSMRRASSRQQKKACPRGSQKRSTTCMELEAFAGSSTSGPECG